MNKLLANLRGLLNSSDDNAENTLDELPTEHFQGTEISNAPAGKTVLQAQAKVKS